MVLTEAQIGELTTMIPNWEGFNAMAEQRAKVVSGDSPTEETGDPHVGGPHDHQRTTAAASPPDTSHVSTGRPPAELDRFARGPLAAWRQLRRQIRESNEHLERSLRSSGSGSLVQFEAMGYLAEFSPDPVHQSQLADALGLSQSSTSRLVSRLEAQGLVTRSISVADGRAAMVALTAAGTATVHTDISTFVPKIRAELQGLARAINPAAINPTAIKSTAIDRSTRRDSSGSRSADGEADTDSALIALAHHQIDGTDALILRNLLEFQVLLDASRNWTSDAMADCRALLEEMHDHVDDDPITYFRADWALHRRILAQGSNQLLQQIYSELMMVVEQQIEELVPTHGLREYLVGRLRLHQDLIEAIASGNVELIRVAAGRHAFGPPSDQPFGLDSA